MDIQDALRKCLDKLRREQAHVSGEADQVGSMLPQGGDDFGIVLGALATIGLDDQRGKAALPSRGYTGRVGAIGDDNGDLSANEFSGMDTVGNGQEVRSQAGKQDSQLFPI